MKVLHFSQNFLIFFYDFSFYATAQKCCLQLFWAWHDPSPWQLYEGCQGKSLFYWALYFSSWFLLIKNWLVTGGWVKKQLRGIISWGDENNNGDENVFTLCYKSFRALHHVSPILWQISEHLQYLLLTKLLDHVTEVHTGQFFQRLENLTWDCIVLFFSTAFWKIRS